jgi:ribosomal protein S18 acetylase RimI-like enzyme
VGGYQKADKAHPADRNHPVADKTHPVADKTHPADKTHAVKKQTPNIHIREAGLEDASGIARVRVASWQSTYRDIIPQDYLDSLSAEEYTGYWQGILAANGSQGYTYVAEKETNKIGRTLQATQNDSSFEPNKIIGFALGGVERSRDSIFKGELYAIYLLEAYQHQGIGRKLVSALARNLIRERINSMLVWVLSDNPARAFYETLGGNPVYEKPMLISGREFKQIAYGWQSLVTLLEP